MYGESIYSVGSGGFSNLINGAQPFVKGSVTAIRNFLVAHGWTGTDDDGTFAQTTITGLGIEFHVPGHPLTFRNIGVFAEVAYILYDPFDTSLGEPPMPGDTDGSGHPLAGIPVGLSMADTVANINTSLTAGTSYTFAMAMTDPITAVGPVIAKSKGPAFNIDATDDIGEWGPAGDNLAGPPPTGGGWYATPTTSPIGDTFRLFIGEHLDKLKFQVQLINGGSDAPALDLTNVRYRAHANPHQFTMQQYPEDVFPINEGSGKYFLVSMLHVPSENVAADHSVASLSGTSSTPLVIHTGGAHGALVGDECWIIALSSAMNGAWYVVAVPAADQVEVSATPGGSPVLGTTLNLVDSGLGHLKTGGIFSAVVTLQEGSLSAATVSTIAAVISVNGVFKSSWSGRAGMIGVGLPSIDVGTLGSALTSDGKSITHAPFVMAAIRDDQEARIIGHLWDSFVELQREDLATRATDGGIVYMNWLHDARTLRMIEASLWFKGQND